MSLRPFFDYLQTDEVNVSPANLRKQGSAWVKAQGVGLENYKPRIDWLRIKVRNSSTETKQFLLINENPNLAMVNFYTEKNFVVREAHLFSSRKPFHDRPIDHRYFVAPFEIQPGEEYTVYIQTQGATHEVFSRTFFWDRAVFFEKNHLEDIGQIFYFGLVFVMVIYNLVVYFIVRENDYLFYTLFVSGMTLTMLGVTGYGFQVLWPAYPWFNERALLFGTGLMLSFAGWFSIAFLNLKQYFPLITKILNILGWLVVTQSVLLLIVGITVDALLLRTLTITALPIYFIAWVAGILTWRQQPNFSTRVYMIAWSMLIIVVFLVLVQELIVPIFDAPFFYLMQIAQCIEVVLLSTALAQRISQHKVNEGIAQGKLEAKSKFLARMSHEIRTPMNGILGMAEILKQKITESESKHLIEVIHNSAKSLQLVINDILDYSKLEAGKMNIIAKPFDIRELIEEVVQLFIVQAEEKKLILGCEVDEKVGRYYSGDPLRIRQVLINLVGNAIKYTEGGFVKINVLWEKNHLVFEVVDSGIGVQPEMKEILFKAFEQADSHNIHSVSSTGLGLAISKELVELMGGQINMTSIPRHGSKFWFELDLPRAELLQEKNIEPKVHGSLDSMKVLVVEDNIINQQVVVSMLKNLSVDVNVVENGMAALAFYKSQAADIDIVLMDCEMPEMDGFEASRKIREWEEEKNLAETPIVALTAHTLHQDLEACFKSGMNDLLLKPITLDGLRQTLERHV